MSTQRQRAINAAVAAAAREAGSESRREAEEMQVVERDGSLDPPLLTPHASLDGAEAVVTPLLACFAPHGSPATSEALVASFRAMILGSDVELGTKPVGPAPDRFAGQPPAAAPVLRAPSIGPIRIRSRRGK